MLELAGSPFTVGSSLYTDNAGTEEGAKIYVNLKVGDLQVVAQLDTGSPWSILRTEILQCSGVPFSEVRSLEMHTRLGRIRGVLGLMPLVLIADEGESYEVSATVFCSEHWRGPDFIGYNGFLERIRFGVDPSANRFYFGPCTE